MAVAMTKSFFSRFKEHLSMNFGGRYLAVVLQEVLLAEPRAIRALLPGLTGSFANRTFDVVADKYCFKGRNGKSRRADLAVLVDDKCVGLVEIKDEDEPLEGQLEDYLFHADSEGIPFTYLTKYRPPAAEIALVTCEPSGSHRLLAELYIAMKALSSAHPVVDLLCRFMEEEGIMAYSSDINVDALTLLVVKGLHLQHNHGLGQQVSEANVAAVPDVWRQLLTNADVLGDRFFHDFRDFFNKRPSSAFGFNPTFNSKLVLKDLQNQRAEEVYIDRRRKTGGDFFVGMSGKVAQTNPNDWLNISFGVSFTPVMGAKQLRTYVYAELDGKGLTYRPKSRLVPKVPGEDAAYDIICDLVLALVDKTLAQDDLIPGFRKSLKGIAKRLRGFKGGAAA